jgi:uncharacterized metal-binding protein
MSEQEDTCSSNNAKTLIMACSGGSNAGQAANIVMVELDKSGVAYWLVGVRDALSRFIESVEAAKTIIPDVSPVGCVMKVLEKYDSGPSCYFVVTGTGIEKRRTLDTLQGKTASTLGHIKSNI